MFKDGKFRELISVEGCDSLIGCFDYKGKTALYVVNNNFTDSGKVTLKFDDNYGYDVVNGLEKSFTSGEVVELELPAGAGALVVLK